jgi:ketosteroid isomerase-like protein
MKTLMAVLAMAASALAATPQPAVEKAVLATEKQWADAMLHRDQATLDKLLGDDLLYTHSSGKHETKADLLQVMATNSLTYTGIDFADTRVRQYGDTVIVSHDATITTAQTGVAHLFVVHVWVKQHGQWQLVHRLATKLP